MANKIKEIPGRLILKHDIESNWNKAETFIPKQGEIIIYDIDDNYNYERFKIGDGITTVGKLKFANNNADWNASEGEPGHVLNRTHWVEGGRVEVLAEMQMPTEGAATDPDIDLDHSIGLKAGETYTVVHNGNEYKCVAQDMSAMMEGVVAMGDLSEMGLASTGEPFLIIDMAPMSSANITTAEYGDTLSIYQDNEVVHKLDPKFLPDFLPLLVEEDMLPAVHDIDGKILTDENSNVILRY